jgi:hypothetical protein
MYAGVYGQFPSLLHQVVVDLKRGFHALKHTPPACAWQHCHVLRRRLPSASGSQPNSPLNYSLFSRRERVADSIRASVA